MGWVWVAVLVIAVIAVYKCGFWSGQGKAEPKAGRQRPRMTLFGTEAPATGDPIVGYLEGIQRDQTAMRQILDRIATRLDLDGDY
jgi:hypothetical protein